MERECLNVTNKNKNKTWIIIDVGSKCHKFFKQSQCTSMHSNLFSENMIKIPNGPLNDTHLASLWGLHSAHFLRVSYTRLPRPYQRSVVLLSRWDNVKICIVRCTFGGTMHANISLITVHIRRQWREGMHWFEHVKWRIYTQGTDQFVALFVSPVSLSCWQYGSLTYLF